MTSDKKPTERSLAAARELLPCWGEYDNGNGRRLQCGTEYVCPPCCYLSHIAAALDAARAEERKKCMEAAHNAELTSHDRDECLAYQHGAYLVSYSSARTKSRCIEAIRALADPEPSEEQ